MLPSSALEGSRSVNCNLLLLLLDVIEATASFVSISHHFAEVNDLDSQETGDVPQFSLSPLAPPRGVL